MGKPFTIEERRTMKRLYVEEQWSPREIAEHLDRSVPGIHRYLKGCGVIRSRSEAARIAAHRRNREHMRRIEEAIQLYRKGLTAKAAARVKNVHVHTLRTYIGQRGLARGRGDAWHRSQEARKHRRMKEEAVRRLRDGEDLDKIAADYGIKRGTLTSRWAADIEDATGIPSRITTLQAIERKRLQAEGLRMLQEGAGRAEVARALDIKSGRLANWIKDWRNRGLLPRARCIRRAA